MESLVLIPEDFVLGLRPSSSSPSLARLLEPEVGVFTRVGVAKGTRFYPAQGTVRTGRLDIYSTLPEDDVRWNEYFLRRYSLPCSYI